MIHFLPLLEDGEDKTSPLKNRIRKNYQHIRKWAKKTKTNAFRIYDKDIKEYPVAIDFYDGRFSVHYFAGSREEEEPKEDLYHLVMSTLKSLFNVKEEDVYWRTRVKREEKEQYSKAEDSQEFFTVLEYGVTFKVNLRDYLDTGLFLDHRETRQIVAKESIGKSLLNLFAYTGSFSVQAAAAGASATKTVDMSNTYLDWAYDNFLLNKLSLESNTLVREDCLKFLENEVHSKNRYDVIIIDPPTISRSKKMDQFFDIQIDYIFLLSAALQLLKENGVIFFSTNSRKFTLDVTQFPNCSIIDISKKTIPMDFHSAKIHRCWKISVC